jgi:oxygen-independent coproporphyrinogen-3 oxidase
MEYFRAMVSDLRSRERKSYNTLYIGGGTPSTADRKMLAAFMDIVSVLNSNIYKEATIEANPESIDEDFCRLVHDYKFTRLSIGCQSTSDTILKKLGRIHSADDVFSRYEMVRRLCPNVSVNLDMIYDIPGTTYEDTHQTMKDLIRLSPEHISAYTYSHDTGFLPQTDDDTTDFLLVRNTLEDAGYIKYEISNFAKAGSESLHNINYWQLGEYDGIGSSAWSLEYKQGKRILKGKSDDIRKYIENPLEYAEVETTDNPQMTFENIVFGLRLLEGVDVEILTKDLDANLKEELYNLLNDLRDKELVSWNGSRLALQRNGELVLDSVQSLLWALLP